MAGPSHENDLALSLKENLDRVRSQIAEAARRASRPLDQVKLLAVSKTKPPELIRAALEVGQTRFGENYVQEALEKLRIFQGDSRPEWHLIGSLQTNKAKVVAGRFALIHSVDREKLAVEISKAAEKLAVTQDVLLQVKVGEEASKKGASLDEAFALAATISRAKGLRLRGVMALPPLTDDESIGRSRFAEVRETFERIRSRVLTPEQAAAFDELSMGTSGDFEWAILEGATMVRVGTSIFGARDPA